MTRNIYQRLDQLNTRRRGTDRLSRLNDEARNEIIANSYIEEGWQKRARNQPYTQYSLGAMQEVGENYTRISIETAGRVGKQLDIGLTKAGFSVNFRLQGSVPLNVHIRGVSDVDLLSLDTSFLTYNSYGANSAPGFYTNTNKSSVGVLYSIRKEAEKILIEKYPAADVDTSGGKAISISGGSLARPVDVVPSHWHDTIEYQAYGREYERGVTILNKKTMETIENLPFLHIHRIDARDQQALNGLKKVIRLCKNVKNDAIEEGKRIIFSSFDIAATMYHADVSALGRGNFFELAILAEAQRFLDELYHDPAKAKALTVPDGSRVIFDTEEKYAGLRTLSVEMDDLVKEVAKEQRLSLGTELTLSDSRNTISSIVVPRM